MSDIDNVDVIQSAFFTTYSGRVDSTFVDPSMPVILVNDAWRCKTWQLYTNTVVDYTDTPKQLILQASPVDSGDIWVNTGTTITPNANENTAVTVASITSLARRLRVITAITPVGADYSDVYLLGQTN